MNKDLIKKCSHCGMYYYANQPHFLKSSKCGEMEKIIKDFRQQNNIPDYEVWSLTIGTDDYMIGFQYDAQETMRNFMKLVAEKLIIY
jgi:hypothetical protein